MLDMPVWLYIVECAACFCGGITIGFIAGKYLDKEP